MQGNGHSENRSCQESGLVESVSLLGLSKTGNASGSNPDKMLVRVQQPPPIYIDAESGKEVTEDWWPDVQ